MLLSGPTVCDWRTLATSILPARISTVSPLPLCSDSIPKIFTTVELAIADAETQEAQTAALGNHVCHRKSTRGPSRRARAK